MLPMLLPFFRMENIAVPLLAVPAVAFDPVRLIGKMNVRTATNANTVADDVGCPRSKKPRS